MEKATAHPANSQFSPAALPPQRLDAPSFDSGDGFADLLSATASIAGTTARDSAQSRAPDADRGDSHDEFAAAARQTAANADDRAARAPAHGRKDKAAAPDDRAAPVNHGQERKAEVHARNEARKEARAAAGTERTDGKDKTPAVCRHDADPASQKTEANDGTAENAEEIDAAQAPDVAAVLSADAASDQEKVVVPATADDAQAASAAAPATTDQPAAPRLPAFALALLAVVHHFVAKLKGAAQSNDGDTAAAEASGKSLPALTPQQIKEALQQHQDKLKEAAGALWPQLQEKLASIADDQAVLQQIAAKLAAPRDGQQHQPVFDPGKFENAGKALEALMANGKNVFVAAQAPGIAQAVQRSGQQDLLQKSRDQRVDVATAKIEPATHHLHADAAARAHSYEQTGQLSALRATRGGPAGLPPAVEQVALALHRGVRNGIDQMTLQLRPVELGRIDIKLDFADGRVSGTVLVDNQAAMDLLQKDVRSLERALQEAGLRADSGCLEFQLRGDQQRDTGTSGQNRGEAAGELTGDDRLWLDAEGDEEIYYVTPGRVNIRV